ncbi:MAG: hypothetical protein HQK61_07940 [Desulfamplus sp.]|nr:hypothetical protein [Desulfamplus sp.]
MVTDFTPSPFRVSTELNGARFKPGDELIIETLAALHSGGPYADASSRVTVRLREELFQPETPVTRGFVFYRSAGGSQWQPSAVDSGQSSRVNDLSGQPSKTNDVSDQSSQTGDASGQASEIDDTSEQVNQQSSDVPDQEETTGDETGYQESESDDSYDTDDVEYPSGIPETLLEKTALLDHQGALKNSLKIPESNIGYGRLEVESAVRDDRGRYVANMKTARYLGKNLFVGIKSPQWVYETGKTSNMQAIVVDGKGNPVDNTKFNVAIQRRVTKASRVKGPGNAYLAKYINEWVTAEEKALVSSSEPVDFEFDPSEPGDYRIIARAGLTAHTASIYTWVVGKGQVLWQAPDDYSLAIIPEKNSFKVGETAKYLVKNPFPGAYALISIERYGVLRQWVQRIENSSQVIEVPVKPDDVPGFFLSVTIISPRVEKPLTNDGVDLGKPAFRMGYVETGVTESGHDINVRVLPEKSIYKPGDTVRVSLDAKIQKPDAKVGKNHAGKEEKISYDAEKQANSANAENSASDKKIELAVAVLDEAVFDLIASGRDHFDISKGFHTLDGLDLENYSLLTNIIGRRKFEKKGANRGGDGGIGMKIRSFFKYVSYWNPSLVTDHDGNANIEFSAPDNLTGWKIFVIAATPEDFMGLGESDFKVNRPTEIRPVMPNQVTAGDSFQAGFSVMNRTDKPRTLNVEVKIRDFDSGEEEMAPVTEDKEAGEPIKNGQENITSATATKREDQEEKTSITKDIVLLPFKRETVFLPVQTKKAGTLTFTAQAKDELDGDAVVHTLKVNRNRSLITVLDYGIITGKESRAAQSVAAKTSSGADHAMVSGESSVAVEHLLYPENIHTDTGDTRVALYPTVLGNMEEAFSYMAKYPYACWEQKLSKAVMASHFIELKDYLPEKFSWNEAFELPDKTLKQAVQFQAPNGGMAYFTPDNSYVCPYLSAYTALAFGWLKSRGFEIPHDVDVKLSNYLATLLRKDVFPGSGSGGFYSPGMASTVRAVALAALANAGKASVDDIIRYEGHLKDMSLFGKAHFLIAALQVNGAQASVDKVWDMILAKSHHSAGKVVFDESLDTGFYRILESSMRTNGALLSAVVQYGKKAAESKSEDGTQKERSREAEDLAFKLVRTITDTRGRKSSGENTQENIFCMNGLAEYSAAYERVASSVRKKNSQMEENSRNIIEAGTLLKHKANTIEAKSILKHELLGDQVMGSASFSDLKDQPVIFTKPISPSDPGKKADIVITSNSVGTLYYSAGMSYAPKDDFDKPVNSGMEIRREYSIERNGKWELLNKTRGVEQPDNTKAEQQLSGGQQETSGQAMSQPQSQVIHPGDLIRVDIFLSLPTARNFPVISDPVPGGLEPVNRDLATSSVMDAQKADSLLPEGSWWFNFKDWREYNESRWSFYHQELGHSVVRYYADYLPAGNYHLSYTAQVVATGSFMALPTHVEEMYDADIFGKGTAEKITVSKVPEP